MRNRIYKRALIFAAALAFVAGVPPLPSLPALAGSLQMHNEDPRTGMDPSRLNQLKDLKVALIKANDHVIRVWLMNNESKRQEGMMFLEKKDVHDNEGMLFVFPQIQPADSKHGFWMHNCPLGLDICYIGEDKKVINIVDGKPWNDASLPPAGPYRWVLEMKTNCAKKLGIKRGVAIHIPSGLKSS